MFYDWLSPFPFFFHPHCRGEKRCRDNQAKNDNQSKLYLGWRNHVSFTFNVIISNAFQSAHNHVTIKSKFVRFLCLKYILQLIHLLIETNAYTNLLEYQLVSRHVFAYYERFKPYKFRFQIFGHFIDWILHTLKYVCTIYFPKYSWFAEYIQLFILHK